MRGVCRATTMALTCASFIWVHYPIVGEMTELLTPQNVMLEEIVNYVRWRQESLRKAFGFTNVVLPPSPPKK